MLPTTGWLSLDASVAIGTQEGTAPEPVVGEYRDFSTLDPAVNVAALDDIVVMRGGQAVIAQIGRDAARNRTLRVRLEQHEVFGGVLVDQIVIPSSWGVPGRPASAFGEPGRPVSVVAGAPARPASVWTPR